MVVPKNGSSFKEQVESISKPMANGPMKMVLSQKKKKKKVMN
jgi:hypothetical protein